MNNQAKNNTNKNNILLSTRILTTKTDINSACALLYEVHVKSMKWEFAPNNPSHLSIATKNKRNILIDRFTDKAIWFGVFSGKNLVGCCRLSGVDENNNFEVEAYQSSNVINKYLPKNKDSYFEMNRITLDRKFKNKILAAQSLFYTVFEYCKKNRYSVMAFSNNYLVNLIFKRIEFPLSMEAAFKYDSMDLTPVNFYFATYQHGDITKILNNISQLKAPDVKNTQSFLEALDVVAQILPTQIYWQDRNGKVLGANEHTIKSMGATRDRIMGHTPYYFYPKDTAEQILKHNDKVILLENVLSQEQEVRDISTGEEKIFSAIKAPLYDDYGNVMGIVGVSIDVTAQKEKEQLKLENLAHVVKEHENDKLRELVTQIAHQLKSPAIGLEKIISRNSYALPKSEISTINNFISRINNLVDKLLDEHGANHEYSNGIDIENKVDNSIINKTVNNGNFEISVRILDNNDQ